MKSVIITEGQCSGCGTPTGPGETHHCVEARERVRAVLSVGGFSTMENQMVGGGGNSHVPEKRYLGGRCMHSPLSQDPIGAFLGQQDPLPSTTSLREHGEGVEHEEDVHDIEIAHNMGFF